MLQVIFYTFLNKTQAANITYNKALQFAKSNIASTTVEAKDYDQLADVYYKLGQTDNKIETYRQGLKVFPENGTLRFGLALGLSSLGKFNEAIEEFRLAIKYRTIERGEESVAWEYSLLAEAQEKIGQIQEAIKSQKKAVSLDQKWYYFRDLAELYKKAGNLNLAYTTINQAIEKHPTALSNYRVKAEILEAQGQIEKAKNSYQEAIKLCPKCAEIYFSFGEFFIRQNDKVSAMKQYQILKSLNPKLAAELLKKINSTKF